METQNNNGAETINADNTNKTPATQGENGANTSVTPPIRQQVRQIAQETQRTASDLVGQVQGQVTTRLTDQKKVASEALHQVADVVKQAGESFREQERQTFGQYADTAADALNDFSEYLQKSDLQTLTRDVESVARQRPALFVGGALVLGLFSGAVPPQFGKWRRPPRSARPN